MTQKKKTAPWWGAPSQMTDHLGGPISHQPTEYTLDPQDLAVSRIASRCCVSVSTARVISELSGIGVAA